MRIGLSLSLTGSSSQTVAALITASAGLNSITILTDVSTIPVVSVQVVNIIITG